MISASAKRFRLLASVLSVLAFLLITFGVWFYTRVRASLPKLDGDALVPGLSSEVHIERDALGVPTIHGRTRVDVARALGYLHGQDRFFQMDLMRRRAAGELSELVGKGALPLDRAARLHAFRRLAETVLQRLPAEHRALLQAYAEGVNTGLSQLAYEPFEYILTRSQPAPWRPEDSFLVSYAMTLDLQDASGQYEQTLSALRDALGSTGLACFAPLIGPDDAALDGSTAPLPALPSPRVLDLRKRPASEEKSARSNPLTFSPWLANGSNAFALNGRHTASGAGLLASDMHLGLRVPNVWYRAALRFPGASGPEEIAVTGVTLPGIPLIVAGSNGHVAWSFTDAYADVSDLVAVQSTSIDTSVYMRGQEILQVEKRTDTLAVRGGDPVKIETPWTVWGPVVGKNLKGQMLALHWIAYDPDATNLDLIGLETAQNVQEAIDVAHRAGIPAQNFVVVDHTGAIGWTICGKIPRRVGFDGRLPVEWGFGDRRWDGFLPPDQVPTLIAPADGKIWTANQRLFAGDVLTKLGDGGYEKPDRAARIGERLRGLDRAAPADLLSVQLDIEAPRLARWQQLFAQVLNDDAVARKKARGELRAAIGSWDGRAAVDSVSYRLVRIFRDHVAARVLTPIFAGCVEMYPDFNYDRLNYEPALWKLIEEKPAHLLNPDFSTWDDLLLAAADDVLRDLDEAHVPIARATWGRRNTAAIRHPLSQFLPGPLGHWLDMPPDPLPGDAGMPRVQGPAFGASERFVVSPGHEAEGIFHMPAGQSGNPLSPFYRAGHEAWVQGQPTPFLPGPTVHTLALRP